MHVLIVEDDAVLGAFVAKLLRMDGYETALVGDGEAALRHVADERPALMVLDLGLPRRDGMEVLTEMGRTFRATSVIVLTGRAEHAEPAQRARCLRLGADDILLKPFSTREFLARCQAILRRRERYADPILRHGDLALDRMSRRATQAGRPIDLTVTEFALLESLLLRDGKCCTRNELMREVWQTSQARAKLGTNILEVYINYLRRKLGQTAARRMEIAGRSVIRTVRGEGYRLVVSGVEPAECVEPMTERLVVNA